MFRPTCGFSFYQSFFALAFFVFLLLLFSACHSKTETGNSGAGGERLKDYPPVILWVWERPEDLRFLNTKKYGAAFLAQTLILQSDEVIYRPRRQPLEVSPDVFLIAVTRIETDKNNRPAFSEAQKNQILDRLRQTLKLPRVKALQIDFDVLESERDFYREIIRELRAQLPENVSLTITALASWCAEDNWFNDLPVDEAVPMAFRMGADDQSIRAFLAAGKDWRSPLCRSSYGIATDEPLKADFKSGRRFYIFNHRAWRAEDLKRLPKEILP